MRGFLTGINAVVKGYMVKDEADMKFAPSGDAVTTCRVGCGGTPKRPATYIDIVAWGQPAEELNRMAEKGLAVRACGFVSQRKWQYNDKWYERLELIYLTELEVQDGEELKVIEIPKRGDGKKEARAIAETTEEPEEVAVAGTEEAENELVMLGEAGRIVLGEDASDEAVAELIAGKGSAKTLKAFEDAKVEVRDKAEVAGIPFK